MSDKTDALESLLNHPGWLLFQSHVGSEWGPKAYAQKLKTAVTASRNGSGLDALAQINLIDETNNAVGALMQWPSEELARLKRSEEKQEPSLTRGGYR